MMTTVPRLSRHNLESALMAVPLPGRSFGSWLGMVIRLPPNVNSDGETSDAEPPQGFFTTGDWQKSGESSLR
jgi:hypothetical protein